MSNQPRSILHLRRDERGNIAILTAFCILPSIFLIGGAIDFGFAIETRETLQSAADAGTLAAAALGYGATSQQRSDTALNVFRANANLARSTTPTPQITVAGSAVSLQASADVPTAFLKLMGLDTLTVGATSSATPRYVAAGSSGGRICLLALDPANNDGIHIQGNNNINYPGCWAQTNSGTATAINSNGSSATAVGAGHCAAGGVSDAAHDFSPAPKTGCTVVPDPYARVSAYAASGSYNPTFTPPTIGSTCKSNNLNLKKGTYTLDPGRYCGGINIQAQATVTLNPGVYVIDNGTLNVQSGASLSGGNVLFYFNGDSATMTLIGGGTISLKGRLQGSSYAGFLFIAKPGASTTQVSNIQGGGTFNLEGLLYMPVQTVLVTGNGSVNGGSKLFGMIARNFDFRGNGVFTLLPATGDATVPDILPALPTEMLSSVSLN